jgi:hypothetical protein
MMKIDLSSVTAVDKATRELIAHGDLIAKSMAPVASAVHEASQRLAKQMTSISAVHDASIPLAKQMMPVSAVVQDASERLARQMASMSAAHENANRFAKLEPIISAAKRAYDSQSYPGDRLDSLSRIGGQLAAAHLKIDDTLRSALEYSPPADYLRPRISDLPFDASKVFVENARREQLARKRQFELLAATAEATKKQNEVTSELVRLTEAQVREATENTRIQKLVLWLAGAGVALAFVGVVLTLIQLLK